VTVVRAGDIELSYERSGSGPPMLMIMGLSGTYSHWDEDFLADLRRDHEVIVYDHRGVGESSRVDEPFTMAQLAEDAAGLLAALDVEEADVFGFSMGGMVAQELALSHPARLRRLVLASTYCGGVGSQRTRQNTFARVAEAVASGDKERAMQIGWEVNVSPAFALDKQARERFIEIARRRRVAVPVLTEQLRAIAAHDTSERLHSLELPTLVIHGTLDEMVPVENGYMIARLIPGARLEILEAAGHMFFWEMPARAAELVRGHTCAQTGDLALERADSA
jgi:pimeloyl-ACP methyl ester carboxylesterase